MMQAMKHIAKKDEKWYLLGSTKSLSTAMAFDRLRMTNTSGVVVGIMNPANEGQVQAVGDDEFGFHVIGSSGIEQIQPFHSGGGWTDVDDEHDFQFDCSGFAYGNGNSDLAGIYIKGISSENIVWQLYAYPTGYSATRNKNAEIGSINYKTVRMATVGTEIARLRLTNQVNTVPYEFLYSGYTEVAPINAKEVRLEGTGTTSINLKLRALVLGGETDGTLSWNTGEADNGGAEAQADYDTLISRNWTITGGRPL